MIKPIVFIAGHDLYVIIPDDSHTKKSWDKVQAQMKKEFIRAKKELGDRKDYQLGLKLLEKYSSTWKCKVMPARAYQHWEFGGEVMH